jgi:hypothetical protein
MARIEDSSFADILPQGAELAAILQAFQTGEGNAEGGGNEAQEGMAQGPVRPVRVDMRLTADAYNQQIEALLRRNEVSGGTGETPAAAPTTTEVGPSSVIAEAPPSTELAARQASLADMDSTPPSPAGPRSNFAALIAGEGICLSSQVIGACHHIPESAHFGLLPAATTDLAVRESVNMGRG